MLSFTDLAADVYWVRAVVHYGGERRSPAASGRYALLHPLLDMTTTLDPHFDVAARMGAIFLSEGYPGGPGRPDLALELLRKGLRHDPDPLAVSPRHRLRAVLVAEGLPGRRRANSRRPAACPARRRGCAPWPP